MDLTCSLLCTNWTDFSLSPSDIFVQIYIFSNVQRLCCRSNVASLTLLNISMENIQIISTLLLHWLKGYPMLYQRNRIRLISQMSSKCRKKIPLRKIFLWKRRLRSAPLNIRILTYSSQWVKLLSTLFIFTLFYRHFQLCCNDCNIYTLPPACIGWILV